MVVGECYLYRSNMCMSSQPHEVTGEQWHPSKFAVRLLVDVGLQLFIRCWWLSECTQPQWFFLKKESLFTGYERSLPWIFTLHLKCDSGKLFRILVGRD